MAPSPLFLSLQKCIGISGSRGIAIRRGGHPSSTAIRSARLGVLGGCQGGRPVISSKQPRYAHGSVASRAIPRHGIGSGICEGRRKADQANLGDLDDFGDLGVSGA